MPKKTVFFISILFSFILLIAACTSSKTSTIASTPKPSNSTTTDTATEEVIKPTRVSFNPNADLDSALLIAKKENKVVFIDFYTTWCYPCKMMDQGAFRDWDVADYMTSNCVALKVDAEKGNGVILGTNYGVKAFPTMVFVDPNGNELARSEGSLGIEDFKKFMKASVWKFRNN